MAGNYDFLLPLIISLSIITLSIFFYRLLCCHSAVKTLRPHSYPLIGFLRNRHRFHDWLTDTFSNSPSLTLQLTSIPGCPHRICTADPTNLQHILDSNFHNYIKGDHYTSIMHELLGTGIINSDTTKLWSAQRRITMPILNTQSMRTFVSNTLQLHVSKTLIPHLSSARDVIDLQQVFRKFSFDYIYNVAIGVEPMNSRHQLFLPAFDAAVEHASSRFMCPVPVVWKLKRYFNVGNERRYKEAIETMNRFVMDVIKSKERRKCYETGVDILSRFMESGYHLGFEDDERRKYLRDNIISFILAGTDPTSTALTWFFWLLDGHPHCKHLIFKEFSVLTSSSRHIHQPNYLTFDELKKLNYLHAALSESMRLFPPVPMNCRSAVYDDILPDGTYVEQGWLVDYSAYAMGRMETLWGFDCKEFKPERWLDGNGVFQPSSSFKYPVFNAGDRMCLWKEMALLQMKSVVVAVMHEFEIEVVGGGGTPEKLADPPYRLSMFLSMKNGLPVRVKKRQQSDAPRAKDRGGMLVSLFGMFLVGLSFYKHKRYKINSITS